MIIGLDIDDVIFDSSGAVEEILGVNGSSDSAGSDLVAKMPAEFLENKVDIMKGDVSNPVARKFLTRELVNVAMKAKPIPGAAETIAAWRAAGHKVILITARGDKYFPGTEAANAEALSQAGILCDGVVYNCGGGKVQACIENGVEVFIDDSPKNCMEVAAAGIRTIGFRSKVLGDEMAKVEVESVGDWGELRDKVSEL